MHTNNGTTLLVPSITDATAASQNYTNQKRVVLAVHDAGVRQLGQRQNAEALAAARHRGPVQRRAPFCVAGVDVAAIALHSGKHPHGFEILDVAEADALGCGPG